MVINPGTRKLLSQPLSHRYLKEMVPHLAENTLEILHPSALRFVTKKTGPRISLAHISRRTITFLQHFASLIDSSNADWNLTSNIGFGN
jgi:hypothetical protein